MIIISDGDPSPPSGGTIKRSKDGGVTVTTVAVGSHGPAGSPTLQNIATPTGGKYYVVNNANALPKIFQREARRIARPLVYEPNPPVSPRITTQHEIVQGLGDAFPPVSGFVLTSVKENSLVDVILTSPVPTESQNATILAAWTYGLGKTVAFTTDAGQRWTTRWTGWTNTTGSSARWSAGRCGRRATRASSRVATDVQGGKTRVIVSALNKDDEFLNYQSMDGTVLGPGHAVDSAEDRADGARPVRGRVRFGQGGQLPDHRCRAGQAMIRTGVNVGYSDEFRDRETNTPLLESIAELPAKKGEPGKLLPPLPEVPEDARRPSRSCSRNWRSIRFAATCRRRWPARIFGRGWCWWRVVCFLADVFVRRVQVNFQWLVPIWTRFLDIVLRRERHEAAPETMSRLRSRKAEVDRSIESRRAATRFEPDAATPVDPNAIAAAEAKPTAPAAPTAQPTKPVAEAEGRRLHLATA